MTLVLEAPDVDSWTQARHFTAVPDGENRPIDLIVLHSMEAPQKPDTAEAVARWLAGPTSPVASAHVCADQDSAVGCVRDHDVAYGAPGANHNGLHLELAGYARQTRPDWDAPENRAMLAIAARRVVAPWCRRYNVPAVYVTAAMLAAGGARGITTHLQVTLSKIAKGDHTDPGTAFPVDDFVRTVAGLVAAPPTPPAVQIAQEADVLPYFSATCPTGGAWWVSTVDGGIFTDAPAPFYGSLPAVGVRPNAPVVKLIPWQPQGPGGPCTGYWLLTLDGGVFNFGGAPFHGSYLSLPPEDRREGPAGRQFYDLRPHPDGTYQLLGLEGPAAPPHPETYELA